MANNGSSFVLTEWRSHCAGLRVSGRDGHAAQGLRREVDSGQGVKPEAVDSTDYCTIRIQEPLFMLVIPWARHTSQTLRLRRSSQAAKGMADVRITKILAGQQNSHFTPACMPSGK